MSDHLSLPIRLPDEDDKRFNRLAILTRRVANHVLEDHWTPTHLDGIADASHQAWKYFDEHEPFEELDLYLPSRFRRCILQKVGETLRSHADRRDAFQSIQSVLPDHKIRRIHRRHIKDQLWDDGDYLSSGYVDILIDQLNSYYDCHGTYPETYFEMQDCPEYDSGVLPFSADDGPTSGQAVKYQYDSDNETLAIRLKTPDTLSPETRGDWSWTDYERDGYEAFHDLLAHGDLSAPEFQPSRRKTGDTYYELSFPVEVEHAETPDSGDCVLALDAGMRKDMTAVVVTEDGEQRSTPQFIRFTDREKMRRLHRERTRLQERDAAQWRIDERFDHYQNALTDIVEKVSRQAVEYAQQFKKPVIVLEDLSDIREDLDYGQWMNRRLHAWAFARLQGRIEEKAHEAGIPVEYVRPEYTSQTCHACQHVGYRNGDEFRCPNKECWVSKYHADLNAAVNIADRLDPWGESLPLKPADDDIPRDGSACDSATAHSEQSQSEQMTLGAFGSEPTASD